MTIEKRPTRPTARPTTSKHSAARPTGSHKRATGSTRPETRSQRVIPAKKSNTGLIIGVCAGVVALIGLIAFAVSSGNTPEPAKPPPPKVEKEPVDVRELVESGRRSCEEGFDVIQSCKSQMDRADLGAAEKHDLKEKLQKGVGLIDKGMNYYEKAREKSGENQGDPKREWGMARKMANNFIANLGK